MHQLSSQSPSLVERTTVKNLGFTLDQEHPMKDQCHVSKLCQSCYFQLHQIRTIWHSLSPFAIRTLVHAFICSRIDFSTSLLYGTSAYLLDRLQSVLNSYISALDSGNRAIACESISTAVKRDRSPLAPNPSSLVFDSSWMSSQEIVVWVKLQRTWRTELYRSINKIPARRNLGSASQVQLLVRRFRKERSGRRGFSISSPQLWNLLPADIRLLYTQDATTFQKETQNSLYAAVHSSPLRIYVTSATSITTTTSLEIFFNEAQIISI